MKANMRANQSFKQDTHAVSPVVATLMLVLVAAGAAVGLNVWMKSFNDDATTNVAKPSDCQKLTIAGSSTVYELSAIVVPDFEAHTRSLGQPVCVDLDMGGSGAGRQAVGLCVVDIGSSSSSVPASEFTMWPDCDRDGKKDVGKELKVFQVATDAVVPVSHPSNSHCTGPLKLTVQNMQEIYAKFANDPVLNEGGTFVLATFLAQTGLTEVPNALTADINTPVTWADLHGNNSLGGAHADNVCSAAQPIIPFDREDPGGTSEVAAQSLLGGKQKQLEDLGITLRANLQGDGNQGVYDKVLAHANRADALYFSGFGYAVDQGMKLHWFGKTTPILPTTSNIKDGSFDATRPILYITAGTPTPTAQLYLDFIMGNPHNNQQYSKAAGFVGLFA